MFFLNIQAPTLIYTTKRVLKKLLRPRIWKESCCQPQEKARFIHEQASEQAIVIQLVETVESVSEWLPMKTVEMMDRLKRVTRECCIEDHRRTGAGRFVFNACSSSKHHHNVLCFIPKTGDNISEESQNIIVAKFMGTLHPREMFEHESGIEVRFLLNNAILTT